MKSKGIFYLFVFLAIQNCFPQKNEPVPQESPLRYYMHTINKDSLIKHVTTLASDTMEGRKTGEEGQKKAASYIRDFYMSHQIKPAKGTYNYFQKVPSDFMQRAFSPRLNDSENVIAIIRGREFPDEYLVLSAHYDHVGMANGEIYNGADDNASGTSGLLEIARVFQAAQTEGYGPKRSIIFLHCTGEEYGLHGSRYYTNYPLYPLEQTQANLNVDMIGRIDDKHQNTPNYLYLIGADRINKQLHKLSEATNKEFTNLILDYTYNDPKDPKMLYYRSDHYNFARQQIPVIFYFNGMHSDYHQPTDTVDKIAFDNMTNRVKLIFATLWQLANNEQPLKQKN